MAKTTFSCRWKHQFTDAPDVDFACVADDETRTVEVEPTPGQLDSYLLIQLAVRTFPDHGIGAVAWQSEGFGNIRPTWKIIMTLGGVRHRVEIVEVMSLGQHKEFTVILKPAEPNRLGRLVTQGETL